MKTIYFVRHGETDGNLNKYFQSSETLLSDAGHEGGKAVAERFRHLEVDTIIASPFIRTQQTAKYISEILTIPVITEDSFFELLRPSDIHGLTHDSVEGKKHREEYVTEFYNKDWKPNGAENYYDVISRLQKSISFLESNQGKSIVVVSHGDYIRSLTTYLLLRKADNKESYQSVFNTLTRMSNVAITEFTFTDSVWKLEIYNDHAHFAE